MVREPRPTSYPRIVSRVCFPHLLREGGKRELGQYQEGAETRNNTPSAAEHQWLCCERGEQEVNEINGTPVKLNN